MGDEQSESTQLAYDAGKALPRVVWPDDYPEEQRKLGMHHCPFVEGTPDYDAYRRGLRDALAGDETDRVTLLQTLEDEIEVTSSAS